MKILWKGIRPKLCGNCAFPQNFHTRKLGEITDFHKMVVSILKHTLHRSAPIELVYRDCKNFDRVIFTRKLEDKLNQQINEYFLSKYF